MNESRTSDEGEHWMLNLDNQSAGWTQRASLLNARNHTAAAAVGGFVYCVGGQHNQEEAEDPQSQVDRYDPTTDTWTQVASLPAPRSHLTGGTFTMNGRIIVVGGGAGFGNPQRTVFSYDPASNKWITLGLLPAARSTVVAGVIGPNQFVSSTGNGPSTTTTTWIGTLS
jgi:N-acetylneuraminic acid mutarotase